MIPVGGFLVLHLWTNTAALAGPVSYARAVDEIQAIPGLVMLEIFGIYLPLAFHALYGVKLAFAGRANVNHYPYNRNYLYLMQRVTGVLAFVFIAYHLWEYRIQKWIGDMHPHSFYDVLTVRLSTVSSVQLGVLVPAIPHVAILYTLGIFACVFHFANGIVGFVLSWGIVVSRRATRLVSWLAVAVGVALFAMGYSTVVFFATGTKLPLGADGDHAEPCPVPPALVDPTQEVVPGKNP